MAEVEKLMSGQSEKGGHKHVDDYRISVDKFVIPSKALTNESDLEKHIISKFRFAPLTQSRMSPDVKACSDGLELNVLPCQLAEALVFLHNLHRNIRPFGALCYVGDAANTFCLFNEAIQGSKNSGMLISTGTPLTLPLFVYSRMRHFRYSQVSFSSETFRPWIDQVVRDNDVVVIDMGNNDIGGVVAVIDSLLFRGVHIVMLNIKDPSFPNNSRLWNMCKQNPMLRTIEFVKSYEDSPIDGGGIGYVHILTK